VNDPSNRPVEQGARRRATSSAPASPAGRPSEAALTDDQAILQARRGDHAAFRVLVERYQGRAYRLALRVLRDEEQARDAVQEAFLKVYSSLDRFEGRSSFYTWLYRLVLNLCLDMKRRDRSDRRGRWVEARPLEEGGAPFEAALEAGGEDERPGPDLALERLELRQQVAKAIDTLPDDARETLLLREVEGLSYQEIATTLGIPKGTVMSRLHYARKRVQRLLVAAGVTDGSAGRRHARDDSGEDGGDA